MTTPDLPADHQAAQAPEPLVDLGMVSESTPSPPAKKRRAPLLVTLGVVVTLLLGTGAVAGAYVGYQFLFGGAHPAEQLPAAITAYAELDLKPGVNQGRKLQALVRKFPEIGTNADSAEQVMQDLLAKLELDDVDVEKDLASWVGVRAGVALWSYEDELYLLAAVASTDDEAAEAALDRITAKVSRGTSAGYIVDDEVALIAVGDTDGVAAVEAAAAEAAEASFADSTRFAPAKEWLDDDHVITMWLDLERIGDVAEILSRDIPEANLDRVRDTLDAKGTFVLGVRATDYGLEAHYRTFGLDGEAVGAADALARLGEQPADADIAFYAKLPDLSEYAELAQALEQPLGQQPPVGGEPLTKQEQAELMELLSTDVELITESEFERMNELYLRANGPVQSPLPPVEDIVLALSEATLIGSVANLDSVPAFHLIAELADAGSAAQVGGLAEMAQMFLPDLEVAIDGSTVTVTGAGGSGDGKLADDADFQLATAAAPELVQQAFYVRLDSLLSARELKKIGPLKAVSVVTGYEGTELVGSIRLLVS